MSHETPHAKIWSDLTSGILLGAIVFSVSYPNLYYFTFKVFYHQMQVHAGFEPVRHFIMHQVLLLVALFMLCGFCGFALSEHYGLPGLGKWHDIRPQTWIYWVPIGIVLALITYLTFDGWFMQRAPHFYPHEMPWALSNTVRSAFSEELIFRFGLLTVAVGATKRWCDAAWANGAVSIFYAIMTLRKVYALLGVGLEPSARNLIALSGAVAVSYVLGAIYLKKGLIPAIFVHLVLSSKFVLYALIG